MNTSLFSKTPTVAVLDNRGLIVRNVAYHRSPDSPENTTERITYNSYNSLGFLIQSADPRLHEAGLSNFTWLMDLSGNILRTQGVDNGTTVSLNDAAGRPFIEVSNISTANDGTDDRSQALTRTWQYEDTSLTGRLLSVTEQVNGEVARITERFVYAGNSEAEKSRNLAGLCVSHYDTAGMELTNSVSLAGVPLSVTRCLLKNADDPEVIADWQGEDTSAWNDKLVAETFTMLTSVDATGAVLTTTDAIGNVQRVAYDVAGMLAGSWLTLKDGTEKIIVKSLTYSAAGQKLREEHGNGVVTTYTYEPETQRLLGIKTERPAGHASGVKVLQDLRYEYDPVGNVLKISNDAEETRFWRNQKVVPESTYAYDSLYQLVSASGREMAGAGQQGTGLPGVSSFGDATYTNYIRTYTYDSTGNLTQIRHIAPATDNNHTTRITISSYSNRGVLSTLTENSSEVDALFTAGGQQKQLQPAQGLVWTARNELRNVTPVVRDGSTDDREYYRYDARSQRILKVSAQKTNTSTQTQQVIYLPCIELRTTSRRGTETESLQVMTVDEAGRAQVRVLHWESGRPADITNNQTRYSYDNIIGSSQLELDGDGNIISMEEYYPYGGTAVWAARSAVEADYKTVRYSGKERDATGLYYYGYRYYQPWVGRWLSADPSGEQAGLNLYRFVNNNPVSYSDEKGLQPWPVSEQLRNLISKRQGRSHNLRSSTHPVYQTALRKRHRWSDNPNSLSNQILNDKDVNPFADSVTMQAQPEHDQLLAQSRVSNALSRLTEPERNIVNLYSQESLPFHTITLGMRELNEQEIAQGYHMGQGIELINALSRLPEYPGTTYRGAFIEKGFTYDTPGVRVTRSMTSTTAGSGDRRAWGTGDYVTTRTFFSTSAARGVAAEFIMRQRFSADFYTDTAILSINGHSGRNITELTHIEQAEVLYPAYSVFRVEGVRKGEFGLEIDLHEVNESIWNEPDVVIRDYRYGNVVKQRPQHMIPH